MTRVDVMPSMVAAGNERRAWYGDVMEGGIRRGADKIKGLAYRR